MTVHKLEAGIDTGPIVYQLLFDIGDADTALSLYASVRRREGRYYCGCWKRRA